MTQSGVIVSKDPTKPMSGSVEDRDEFEIMAAQAGMRLSRVVSDERYESFETEYAWLGWHIGRAQLKAENEQLRADHRKVAMMILQSDRAGVMRWAIGLQTDSRTWVVTIDIEKIAKLEAENQLLRARINESASNTSQQHQGEPL